NHNLFTCINWFSFVINAQNHRCLFSTKPANCFHFF
ncbi:hypothetical protein NT04LM_3843, partial [Listeria monocytogenes FSL F2-208]